MVMPELTLNPTEGKVVKVGSKVTFVDDERNKYTFTLSPTDAKPEEGKISIHSPVGKVLLGSKLGDKVKV